MQIVVADQGPRSLQALPGPEESFPFDGATPGIGLPHVEPLAPQPHKGIKIRAEVLDLASQLPDGHHLAAARGFGMQQQGRRRQRPGLFLQKTFSCLAEGPVVVLQKAFMARLQIIHGRWAHHRCSLQGQGRRSSEDGRLSTGAG
jgi:hypothetical protein